MNYVFRLSLSIGLIAIFAGDAGAASRKAVSSESITKVNAASDRYQKCLDKMPLPEDVRQCVSNLDPFSRERACEECMVKSGSGCGYEYESQPPSCTRNIPSWWNDCPKAIKEYWCDNGVTRIRWVPSCDHLKSSVASLEALAEELNSEIQSKKTSSPKEGEPCSVSTE